MIYHLSTIPIPSLFPSPTSLDQSCRRTSRSSSFVRAVTGASRLGEGILKASRPVVRVTPDEGGCGRKRAESGLENQKASVRRLSDERHYLDNGRRNWDWCRGRNESWLNSWRYRDFGGWDGRNFRCGRRLDANSGLW